MWDRSGLETAGRELEAERPVRKDERPVWPFAQFSDFDFLCDTERILQLDAEVSHGAVDLGMAKKKLYGAQISGLAIYLCRLRTPQRVRAVATRV